MAVVKAVPWASLTAERWAVLLATSLAACLDGWRADVSADLLAVPKAANSARW